MGLLKKKSGETEAAQDQAAEDGGEPTEAVFSAEPAAEADAPAETAAVASEAGAEASDEPVADADDALLSMFHATQAESHDREVLLDMAGTVEIADLLDELQTVAAAMHIVIEREDAA
jgi:hypothetical protein